jgi:transposase
MTKFTDEEKMAVLVLIENGMSINQAAKQLGSTQRYLSRLWQHYCAGGTEQVFHVNRRYSPEFKQKVVETRWQDGLSLNQTATRFRIPTYGIISQWEKKYLASGLSGLLPKRKGRPPTMPKKKKQEQESKERNLTREEELEKENAYLRMENAYLKKLNALVRQRKHPPKKNGQ